MAKKTNRLSTSARPLSVEALSAEDAARVNGGHLIMGLIVNPNNNPSSNPPPKKHHHHHKHPIMGLLVNPNNPQHP
jgi:hypothetical protein